MKRAWLLVLTVALSSLASMVSPATASAPPRSFLDGDFDRWLIAAAPWMHGDERLFFSRLTSDIERELFLHHFWRAREDAAAPRLDLWHANFEKTQRRFAWLDDERARAMLIAGQPAEILRFESCRGAVRPLELWRYTDWHARRRSGRPDIAGFDLVFYREASLDGTYRHWSRRRGLQDLLYRTVAERPWSAAAIAHFFAQKDCRFNRPSSAIDMLEAALGQALDALELRQRLVPPPPDPLWLADFRQALDSDAARLPADELEIRFPGRYQGKTIVYARLAIPTALVARNANDQLFDRLVITGDVKLGERLVDAFRVVHYVAGDRVDRPTVALELYRRLPPGTYQLRVRAADAYGRALLRRTLTLDVPRRADEATPPAGYRKGFAGLTRAEVGVLTTFPSLEIVIPEDEVLIGDVEIEAWTTGGPIGQVELHLDGATVARLDEAPYSAVVDLGNAQRRRSLVAMAFDPTGREIASDMREIEVGAARRFAVRLLEPRPGEVSRQARARVAVPAGKKLDRVDFYLGGSHLGSRSQPPFVQPLPPLTLAGRPIYVGAVATLADGTAVEDLVIVYSPDPIDEVDVELVELYAAVVDGQGKFVAGLTSAEMLIRENGVEQQILRLETVASQALNVALSMDVSGSMRRGRLEVTSRSARRFFATVLTDQDRASLLTFNHEIRQVVPFTADSELLHWSTMGLRAWGTTRLHDSLIWTVHSFAGLAGRRALILLSDGRDVDSDFYFAQVLEIALRTGVTVYPILLDVDDEETRSDLERLAFATGGSPFAIQSVAQLDRVYQQIEEELRSQYLLVYRPPAGGERGFRRVEVEALRSGLRVRAPRGYYP